MRTLAKKIGISDVAVAKHCRKSNVPVPERGYWNKLQAGQHPVKAELSPSDLGTVNEVTMSGELPPELLAHIKGEPGVGEQESIDLLAERFRKRLGTVKTPRSFSPIHPAIATLLKKDEQYRQQRASTGFSWPEPRFESDFERRRLRIINGIFLAVAKTDGDAWLRGDYAREVGLRLGDRTIMFELDHTGRPSRPGYTPTPPNEKRPKLWLRLGAQHSPVPNTAIWEDKEGLPLEDQLADIVVGLALEAERSYRDWIVRQTAWRQEMKERDERAAREKKEADERRERERLAAIERAKVNALVRDALSWRRAADIRSYVEAVRAARHEPSRNESLDMWSSWALAEADKLDPIVSGRSLPPAQD
jgi:hypothetical protein